PGTAAGDHAETGLDQSPRRLEGRFVHRAVRQDPRAPEDADRGTERRQGVEPLDEFAHDPEDTPRIGVREVGRRPALRPAGQETLVLGRPRLSQIRDRLQRCRPLARRHIPSPPITSRLLDRPAFHAPVRETLRPAFHTLPPPGRSHPGTRPASGPCPRRRSQGRWAMPPRPANPSPETQVNRRFPCTNAAAYAV